MSIRTRVAKLESGWETDDLIAVLKTWVNSLPLEDVRCLAAFAEAAGPFSEGSDEMLDQDARGRALRLLKAAPEEVRRAYLGREARHEP
ncbi:MAG: hypothetical protein AB7I38_02630 [Dehalococcoidia bacterium]